MTQKKKMAVVIIYFTIFMTIWTIYRVFIDMNLSINIENKILCAFIKNGIIRVIVYTIPAIILIKHYKNDVSISLKEMFTTKVNWMKYLPIFIVFTIFILIYSYIGRGELAIQEGFGLDEIIIVLFVGLTEEMVARGWLLNFIIEDDKKWKGIIISIILFILMHFPKWILAEMLIDFFTSYACIVHVALAFIFGWTFIKSRSILVPIVLHMYWDLLLFVFFASDI